MTEVEGGGMVTRPCLLPLKPSRTPCAFINHLPDSFSAFLLGEQFGYNMLVLFQKYSQNTVRLHVPRKLFQPLYPRLRGFRSAGTQDSVLVRYDVSSGPDRIPTFQRTDCLHREGSTGPVF
jgi:hypothetical protein